MKLAKQKQTNLGSRAELGQKLLDLGFVTRTGYSFVFDRLKINVTSYGNTMRIMLDGSVAEAKTFFDTVPDQEVLEYIEKCLATMKAERDDFRALITDVENRIESLGVRLHPTDKPCKVGSAHMRATTDWYNAWHVSFRLMAEAKGDPIFTIFYHEGQSFMEYGDEEHEITSAGQVIEILQTDSGQFPKRYRSKDQVTIIDNDKIYTTGPLHQFGPLLFKYGLASARVVAAPVQIISHDEAAHLLFNPQPETRKYLKIKLRRSSGLNQRVTE